MIHGILTDSRAIREGELFVAIRGEKYDGHDFVEKVAEQRGAGAVVSRPAANFKLPQEFALLEVADTLAAYQSIAANYRRTMPMKVVAITGSNGKTSTKDLAASVLEGRYRVVKTSGNFNNHLGVPHTLLRAKKTDEVAVLELGMNHPGEIAPLAAMAAPEIAIVTNIGTAHIEYLRSRAAIAQEKGELVAALPDFGCVILSAEDDFSPAIAERTRAQCITVGFTRGDLRAEDVRYGGAGVSFALVTGNSRLEVYLPIPGKHMVLNGLMAVAVGRACGMTLEECAAGLAKVQLTKSRLELKTAGRLRILDDSYNANPESMVAALQTLAQMPSEGKRIAVLGKMGELGAQSFAGYCQVGRTAAELGVDHLLAVGIETEPMVQAAWDAGLKDALMLTSVEEAAEWLKRFARKEDFILLKGSRSAGMERVLTSLTTATSHQESGS